MGERTLTAAVKAEVDKSLVRAALFVELVLDSTTLRLWTGTGSFTLGGNPFTGVGTYGGMLHPGFAAEVEKAMAEELSPEVAAAAQQSASADPLRDPSQA